MVMIRVLFIARYPLMRLNRRLITGIVANNQGIAVAPRGNHRGKSGASLDQTPVAMFEFFARPAGAFVIPSRIAPG